MIHYILLLNELLQGGWDFMIVLETPNIVDSRTEVLFVYIGFFSLNFIYDLWWHCN